MRHLLALHGIDSAEADRRARLLRRPPLALDQHGDAARRGHARSNHRGVRAPRHPRDLAVARPGPCDRSRAHRASSCATMGSCSPATAAAACSRRSTRPARRAALDDNRRAVDEARRLGAACLVLVVGGLPGALAGAPQSKDLFAARARRSRRHRRDARVREERRHAARDRAAASDVRRRPRLRQHDRAGARPLRRARSDGPWQPARAGALGVAVDVYHVWWDPKLEAQIARAGRERLLAFHVCDWLVPTRDLLDDRGMMGDGVIEIPRIRGWVEAAGLRRLQRGRDLLERELVEATRRRGRRDLHRAAPQRRLD